MISVAIFHYNYSNLTYFSSSVFTGKSADESELINSIVRDVTGYFFSVIA